MPTRKNFRERVNTRRKSALERLEAKKAMMDEQLDNIRKNPDKKPIEKYRQWLNGQIEILKARITNG